jgi:endoglucanase
MRHPNREPRARRFVQAFVVPCALGLGAAACGRETVVAVTKAEGHPIVDQPVDGGSGGASSGPVAPPGPGYHTDGATIVNDTNTPVHFRGVSWFGLETTDFVPHGLWARPMGQLLDLIKTMNFNMLRVPWSSQLLDPGSVPKPDGLMQFNPELVGLTGIEIMDRLVTAAAQRGLYVILDHHRATAGSAIPLWKDAKYDDLRFIEDWRKMASRYLDTPAVVGCDLHADLRDPATWGDGNPDTDWRAAAERAGNAILGVNPRLLIIVEGVERAGGAYYWRGGNLRGVRALPVELVYSGKVVYGTQDFPASVGDQPPGGATWLTDMTFPTNLPGVWEDNWGYLVTTRTAPVLVAAFGTELMTDADREWLSKFAKYISDRQLDFAYWSLNPNSTYTGGVLNQDWMNPRGDLLAALAPILPAQ